jgi:hypothetical protein
MVGVKEMYEKLRAKHDLPGYDELNHVFEIESIEPGSFLVREIRRNIIEIMKEYLEILEDLIHPNSTVSAFHECKFFDDNKKSVYDLYGRLMTRFRESNVLDLQQDDKLDAKFIREMLKEWPVLRKDLLNILTRLQRCWIEEEMADKGASYFG